MMFFISEMLAPAQEAIIIITFGLFLVALEAPSTICGSRTLTGSIREVMALKRHGPRRHGKLTTWNPM
jgi:hypothetical protein